MTNDDGRKPEGAPERSPKAGVGVLGCFFRALVDSGDPLARRPGARRTLGAPRRPGGGTLAGAGARWGGQNEQTPGRILMTGENGVEFVNYPFAQRPIAGDAVHNQQNCSLLVSEDVNEPGRLNVRTRSRN
jgi:hypothetical protein